jgi:hypothetical protein
MATGKKTGGRRRGTPNKITAKFRQQALASGRSMLQIMVENARWVDEQVQELITELAQTSGVESERLLSKIVEMRIISHQLAARAAPFFHPQLADIKHDPRSQDGKTIRPVIEITGYPASREIAPPPPALPAPVKTSDMKH